MRLTVGDGREADLVDKIPLGSSSGGGGGREEVEEEGRWRFCLDLKEKRRSMTNGGG